MANGGALLLRSDLECLISSMVRGNHYEVIYQAYDGSSVFIPSGPSKRSSAFCSAVHALEGVNSSGAYKEKEASSVTMETIQAMQLRARAYAGGQWGVRDHLVSADV